MKEERWCYGCGETKPLTEEYWYHINARSKTFKTLCRKCCNYQSKMAHRIARAKKKEANNDK